MKWSLLATLSVSYGMRLDGAEQSTTHGRLQLQSSQQRSKRRHGLPKRKPDRAPPGGWGKYYEHHTQFPTIILQRRGRNHRGINQRIAGRYENRRQNQSGTVFWRKTKNPDGSDANRIILLRAELCPEPHPPQWVLIIVGDNGCNIHYRCSFEDYRQLSDAGVATEKPLKWDFYDIQVTDEQKYQKQKQSVKKNGVMLSFMGSNAKPAKPVVLAVPQPPPVANDQALRQALLEIQKQVAMGKPVNLTAFPPEVRKFVLQKLRQVAPATTNPPAVAPATDRNYENVD